MASRRVQSVFLVSCYLPHFHTTCGKMNSQSSCCIPLKWLFASLVHQDTLQFLTNLTMIVLKMQATLSLKHTSVLIYLKPLLGHLLYFCFFSVSTMGFSPLSTFSVSFSGFHRWSYSLLTVISLTVQYAFFLNYYHMEMAKSVFCRGTSFLLCPKLKSSSQATSFCSYLIHWHNPLFLFN